MFKKTFGAAILMSIIQFSKLEDVYFAPSVFVNHGGGPYPVLRGENDIEIADAMLEIPNLVDLSRLKTIVVVTAHREEDIVTISSGERHSLVYDYTNKPPESYHFKYDAPGDPILAAKLNDAFKNAGINSTLDDKRGWDHGVFIPMMLINPKADIPIVQVSILNNQDASQHYDIGKVLYEFRKDGIAIFGSGMSYHNMDAFQKAHEFNDNVIDNKEFDDFLNDVCTGDVENGKRIISWYKQNGGLEAHPLGEADHLMPLIVNVGAAGSHPGRNIFSAEYLKKFTLSGFMWNGE